MNCMKESILYQKAVNEIDSVFCERMFDNITFLSNVKINKLQRCGERLPVTLRCSYLLINKCKKELGDEAFKKLTDDLHEEKNQKKHDQYLRKSKFLD